MRKLNYLVRNTHIETVYINVTPHGLSPHKTGVNNLSQSTMYTALDDYRNLYLYVKIKHIKRHLPFFEIQSRQVTREDLSPEARQKTSKMRINTLFPTEGTSQEMEQDLLKIIAVCKKHHIRLIGLKFPLASEYLPLVETKSDRAAEILRSKGYPVLDFSMLFQDHTDYFANQDHLNKKGAETFIKHVWSEKVVY